MDLMLGIKEVWKGMGRGPTTEGRVLRPIVKCTNHNKDSPSYGLSMAGIVYSSNKCGASSVS